MKLLKAKKGFTIIELVIVIGVIAILAGILIPTFVNLNSKAEDAAMKSNCANAYSAYVAEAGDGVIDETGAPIAFASQEDVQLEKDAKKYVFDEVHGWQATTSDLSRANFTLSDVSDPVVEFNGYTVKYLKANA